MACWSHARRHVYEHQDNDPQAAAHPLALMNQLYDVERRSATMSAEARGELRAKESRLFLDRLKAFLDGPEADKVLPSSKLGGALQYGTNRDRHCGGLLAVERVSWPVFHACACKRHGKVLHAYAGPGDSAYEGTYVRRDSGTPARWCPGFSRLVLKRAGKTRLKAFVDGPEADKVLPSSKLGGALQYVRNHWEALTEYVREGRLPIDNNQVERLMKRIAIGRKNWLFIGSVRAGIRSANRIS